MTANPDSRLEAGCSPSERKSTRRYRIEIAAATFAYVALLEVSVRNVDHAAGALKVALALLPMLGVLAMSIAFVRFTLRQDEFQRQTIFLSAAIAALVCGLVTMSLGFLENAGGPRIDLIFVWPMILGAFGIAVPFVRRRYR